MKEIVFNSLWVIMERSGLIIAGLLSTIYIARYLGPENYGMLSYLVSIVALITPFIQLGSDNVIFNRIAKKKESGMALMSAALILKFVLCIIFYTSMMIWAKFSLSFTQQKVLYVLIIANLFVICDIYRIYYDATLASKVNTIINNLSLVIFVLVNLAMVYFKLSLFWFTIPLAMRSLLPFIARRVLYKYTKQTRLFRKKKTIRRKALLAHSIYLLKVGMPLAISGLAITIYTRIDQILLGKYLGYQAVGIYNAATAIGQGWAMVPSALIMSSMALIANDCGGRQSSEKIRSLYLIILLLSLPAILILTIFNNYIIELSYGVHFIDAAGIVWICSLTSLCSVLGTLAYRVILLHSGYQFVAIKMAVVALINIGLNYFFIPIYGIKGAAFSTLTAEFSSLIILNALFKKGLVTRPLFFAYKSVPSLITEVKSYVKSACKTNH